MHSRQRYHAPASRQGLGPRLPIPEVDKLAGASCPLRLCSVLLIVFLPLYCRLWQHPFHVPLCAMQSFFSSRVASQAYSLMVSSCHSLISPCLVSYQACYLGLKTYLLTLSMSWLGNLISFHITALGRLARLSANTSATRILQRIVSR